jgi:hypothetical protein
MKNAKEGKLLARAEVFLFTLREPAKSNWQ